MGEKQHMTFESECDQVSYELQVLIRNSKEAKFTAYLNATLNEVKSNPSKAMDYREKIISNYQIYAQRMNSAGANVDRYYFRSIYGDMDTPVIISPYSNDSSPYSNGELSTTPPEIKQPVITPQPQVQPRMNSQPQSSIKLQPQTQTQPQFSENKPGFWNVLGSTFIFLGAYLFINKIGGYIGGFLGEWLGRTVNYDTFLGKLIDLFVLSWVVGLYYFWIMTALSNWFLLGKKTAIFALVVMVILSAFAFIYVNDWVTLIVAIIQFLAINFPIFVRITILSDNKKKNN